jgi:hypothetical protein
MPWYAKPGYLEYHRAVVERIVNALPLLYLLPPCSGELFEGLEDYNRRLRGYALAEGFDIVRHGGDTKVLLRYTFKCIFYDNTTQNHRKLEDYIKRDSKENIINRRLLFFFFFLYLLSCLAYKGISKSLYIEEIL